MSKRKRRKVRRNYIINWAICVFMLVIGVSLLTLSFLKGIFIVLAPGSIFIVISILFMVWLAKHRPKIERKRV